MYLGLITLQSPLLPGAPEACRALAAQRLDLRLPAGNDPLYTKWLAAQTGAEVAEAAAPEQALAPACAEGESGLHPPRRTGRVFAGADAGSVRADAV